MDGATLNVKAFHFGWDIRWQNLKVRRSNKNKWLLENAFQSRGQSVSMVYLCKKLKILLLLSVSSLWMSEWVWISYLSHHSNIIHHNEKKCLSFPLKILDFRKYVHVRFFCWFFFPLIIFLHCIWSICLLGCSSLTPCPPYIYFFGSWGI